MKERSFVKLSELKAGDFIESDGGYACTREGVIAEVQQDKEGLWYRCDGGKHYLDQTGIDGDTLVGFYKVNVEIKDPISLPPVLFGEGGKAWLCNEAAGLKKLGAKPEDNASLAHWVIEAPWAHPIWHSYSLVLIHLRPMAKQPSPKIHFRDATHEMWLHALNPDKDRNHLLSDSIVKGHWLTPSNFAAQFIEINDYEAKERIKRTVQMICDKKLSPDTDFRSEWVKLYGDNMLEERRSLFIS